MVQDEIAPPWAVHRNVGNGRNICRIEGRGVADAAYAIALHIELCALEGIPLIGGAADIFKCFDQILRPLVYEMMEMAGMPEEVLVVYRDFLENMVVHNTIAGGLERGGSQ